MHAVFIVSPAKHTWKEFEEVSEVSNTKGEDVVVSHDEGRTRVFLLC